MVDSRENSAYNARREESDPLNLEHGPRTAQCPPCSAPAAAPRRAPTRRASAGAWPARWRSRAPAPPAGCWASCVDGRIGFGCVRGSFFGGAWCWVRQRTHLCSQARSSAAHRSPVPVGGVHDGGVHDVRREVQCNDVYKKVGKAKEVDRAPRTGVGAGEARDDDAAHVEGLPRLGAPPCVLVVLIVCSMSVGAVDQPGRLGLATRRIHERTGAP